MSMRRLFYRWSILSALVVFLGYYASAVTDIPWITVAHADDPAIPDALQPWQGWVTWDDKDRNSPPIYSSADDRVSYWPSTLNLDANNDGATWETRIRVFKEGWIPIAGSQEAWPVDVTLDDSDVVVVPRDGKPFVRALPGEFKLSGRFRWNRMPQTLMVPRAIGILNLTVAGESVSAPKWDAGGRVWLRRIPRNEQDKDRMSVLVYRVIEDGIPIWLRTQIELTVSGKSREEVLGSALPAGWKISTVQSPIPVAIDESGLMKAQVRPGKWTIEIDAFRTSDPEEIGYAQGVQPIVNQELVGLKSNVKLRIVQLEGLSTVDATQTDFPSQWSGLPIYLWKTNTPFRLVQKMRGMGSEIPDGLQLSRNLWLDEDGSAFTYQDHFRGQAQRIWRLDANTENQLGAVRIDDQPQLITSNPANNLSGVEIRTRNLKMDAIGRMDRGQDLSAIGWQTDAESLNVTLTLPPGWRAIAVFGADQVIGDWLTAWSLLDLFLLLIFSLAVGRLYGIPAGIVALLGFGLAYHELGAPRFTWFFLLIPIALLRVVGSGAGRRWLSAWKFAAIGLFLWCLIPFIAFQAQSALYPQLEPAGYMYGARGIFRMPGEGAFQKPSVSMTSEFALDAASESKLQKRGQIASRSMFDSSNLLQDPTSKIQTGPARPRWHWNEVRCVWNGPVSSEQSIRPILFSPLHTRILTVVRLILLLLLTTILLRGGGLRLPGIGRKKLAVAAAILIMALPSVAAAQLPDQVMLETLRQRLLETSDAFPAAADIPTVALKVDGTTIDMTVQIHAAVEVAVPLPGRLPAWSPVSVQLDNDSDAVVSRRDGFLWVIAPPGVHEFSVKGVLPSESDWEWTFLLKPRYVSVDAEGWKVSGVNRDGVPDGQVFFVREANMPADVAAYDRTDFNPIVVIDRYFEIGLVSQVRTVVTRLSSPGKAVALQVPLLDRESVISGNIDIENDAVAVRMAAMHDTFAWDSELPQGATIALTAAQSNRSVERWHLVTSPIWSVALEGLAPVFEDDHPDLIPTWQPWPGESVTIRFSKPKPISGENMTIQNVRHQNNLGSRQRLHELTLDLECSLATDFVIKIDPDAEITSLKRDGEAIPVQRNGAELIVPARPKKQQIAIEWKTAEPLGFLATAGQVTLPTNASNVTMAIRMPDNRWVLWADGPTRGPAVRFWVILIIAILAAIALGSLAGSPIGRLQWILLVIGLTQVHLIAAMIVVGWLFLLAWRGTQDLTPLPRWQFNFVQLTIVVTTVASLIILVIVVGEGLLGNPKMFIVGNGSSQMYLQWFQPRIGAELPTTRVFSVSVWFYRILMLLWALWLASALLGWLAWGWKQFSLGGVWKHRQHAKGNKSAAMQTEA